MSEPIWSDLQIAEFTTTHDSQVWNAASKAFESCIPTAEVTAFARRLRDEMQAWIDALEERVRACGEAWNLKAHEAGALEFDLKQARSAWPNGDAAGVSLARAMRASFGYETVAWDDAGKASRDYWRMRAAAVLARLNTPESEASDAE